MKLSDIATIKTNFPEADFWIVRRGSLKTCGEPTKEFNPEHIGVKIDNLELDCPNYYYYLVMMKFNAGYFRRLATGTTSLVNIRVSDVRNFDLMPL